MGSSITFSRNRIVINEDNLNIYMAVKLMQNIVDMCPSYKTKIVIDLSKVIHFSQSGILIIRRLVDEFEGLKLEGAQDICYQGIKKEIGPSIGKVDLTQRH